MPTFEESVAAGGRQVGPERHDPPLEIVEYDAGWPDLYEALREHLAAALGPGLAALTLLDLTDR